jgi:predicted PolB exonuclease-like 3'-5' exonuclease
LCAASFVQISAIEIHTARSRSSAAASARVRQSAAHVKSALNELSRIMGLPGKPHGITGAEVERYFREGRIREIADYCESDVVNTYRVWLRYELFRGRHTEIEFSKSETNLAEFIKVRANAKPHLHDLIDVKSP